MLPPRRPFREKPAPLVIVRKKCKPVAAAVVIIGGAATERRLKPALVVLGRSGEAAGNVGT